MAIEKFIHGKRDSAKHDGKYANVKREQASEYHLQHWREETATYAKEEAKQQDNVSNTMLRLLAT